MDIDVFNSLFLYNAETGELSYKVDVGNKKAGSIAGCKAKSGYMLVKVNYKQYCAHRIAWAIHHGTLPDGQIDHINGCRSDNRICNLRLASNAENQQNLRASRGNTRSGLLGVAWCKTGGKWKSRIKVDGRLMHLGMFENKADAYDAYLEAKKKLHPYQTLR